MALKEEKNSRIVELDLMNKNHKTWNYLLVGFDSIDSWLSAYNNMKKIGYDNGYMMGGFLPWEMPVVAKETHVHREPYVRFMHLREMINPDQAPHLVELLRKAKDRNLCFILYTDSLESVPAEVLEQIQLIHQAQQSLAV